MKSVKTVKNSLKFKAMPRAGLLSIKLSGKKYCVPVDARLLANGRYLFLSFPACSELFEVSEKELIPMEPEADGSDAYAYLNPVKHRRRRQAAHLLPTAVAEALKSLPEGFKLGYDTQGNPRLVRVRKRQRAGA